MKNLSFLFILLLAGTLSQAQTFNEWFRQKKTQKRYLLQQIVALKVYLDFVQKGYAIAQDGLTAISDIKKGDFDLHQEFFHSLKSVNPKVTSYAKVAAIVALQRGIIRVYKDIRRRVRKENRFTGQDTEYASKVFENVLNDCSEIVMNLTAVITSGKLEMKDDERLKQIDALYTDMQEAYGFTQSFGAELKLLAFQRLKEEADVQTSREWNDLTGCLKIVH